MKFGYNNRDLSWLTFNYRVLEEAKNKSLPVYERIKFLAIYSNNLEEFYRVRVSYYRSLIRELPKDHPKIAKVKPEDIVLEINKIVSRHQKEFDDIFYKQIIPDLEQNGILLVDDIDSLNKDQQDYLEDYFHNKILPNIQPVILQNKRVKPFLKTGHIYLAIRMTTSKGSRNNYGLIKLPVEYYGLDRFVNLPEKDSNHYILFLEDIVMQYINIVFPGYKIHEWFSVKMTRDADLEMDEQEVEELIETVSNLSTTRQLGLPNRFQYDRNMPKTMINYLCRSFDLHIEDLVGAGRRHNFREFFSFPNPLAPKLENPQHLPLKVAELDSQPSILQAVEEKEYMLHFPYQSYKYFINYLNEAALDDDVVEIKTTQYRVAANSAVVEALTNAALHGKKVTVFVELKARFDEELNLRYAKEMKKAGVNIIYSIPNLKVHAKVALIIKKPDAEGKKKKSCFLGTGNFNENTARLYCDHGFFTSDERITSEIFSMFSYLEDQTENCNCQFKHILVPNFNMVETYKALIDQEIKQAKKGKYAYILLKANGLEDPAMIDKLYEASLAGVKIDCLIRGVCCLKTEQKYSKNIRVIRIIDTFLEHARVFYFHAKGEGRLYMGSADWMKRNLYKRIECVFPIYNDELKKEILDIYDIQLQDNSKSSLIGADMENQRIKTQGTPIRCQSVIYSYLKEKHSSK